MEWHGDNALAKIPPKLLSIISNSIQHSENIIVDIDRTFHIDSEYAPDILFVMPDVGAVIKEKEFDQRFPMTSADYIPITGMSRYRIEECEGSVEISHGSYLGSDLIEDETFWKLEFDRMISNPSNLRPLIVDKFPSLDVKIDGDDNKPNPIFCAVSVKGEYCDIIGVYQPDNGALSGDMDVAATAEAVSLISTSIHETAAELSKFRVIVHSSIFDRVANEEISIPISFLDREAGGLEHPMHVRLSKKISREMNLIPDVEFCIFRDQDHLFMTVTAPNRSASMVRIPFSDLTTLQGRVTGQKVKSALTKALALKRDKSGISSTSFNRIRRGWEDGDEKIGTRVGLGLRLATMNAVFDGATDKDGATWQIKMNNDNARMFYSLAPVMLHLCLARFDPSLRGELRKRAEPGGRKANRRNVASKKIRLFDWGTDSIRYISEEGGDKKSRHWVSSHVRRIEIRTPKTIRQYERKGFPVIRNQDNVIGFRIIRGHYRGSGGVDWDGNYKFGKSPSYYSLKAIRWLRSIENEEGVSIQHAEKGGEWRIPIGESHIQIDGWCKETNTAYEFHGDVYHGNPEKYDPEEICHPFQKGLEGTAGYLYEKTMQKEDAIRSRGFNLVTMWESDWDKIENYQIKV